MKPGWITFAGAGPGAVDLLTLRCRDAIAEADVIVYAGSLVNPDVLGFARPACEIIDSAGMALPEIMELLISRARSNQKVLRLHTGDSSLYGATAEQMVALDRAGVSYETIPGVTAAFAAAAALNVELTAPGISQTLILTRRAGRTPVPEGQALPGLASHGATLALYLSVSNMEGVIADLLAGSYTPETPAAVVYRASWPDEKIISGTLADIGPKVKAANIGRQAMILVGDSLGSPGEASRLYAPEFSHGWRSASDPATGEETRATQTPALSPVDREARHFAGPVAVYALTKAGCHLALKIADRTGGRAFLSARHSSALGAVANADFFEPDTFGQTVTDNWRDFAGHVFVMASGIVIRKVAPLLHGKTTDPATVVCDEAGQYTISLLGGHMGGANRLARRVAKLLGSREVITTATDIREIPAIDDIAGYQGWRIKNPKEIKRVNTLLLEQGYIGMAVPEPVVRQFYADHPRVEWIADAATPPASLSALVVLDGDGPAPTDDLPVLHLESLPLAVGIGCKRNVAADDISHAVDLVFTRHGLDTNRIGCMASADLKADEPGLLQTAETRGWPPRFYPADQLSAQPAPSPSPFVQGVTGSPSVAEAAALAAGAGRLLVNKQKVGPITVAVATMAPETKGPAQKIYVVGTGPGTPRGMTAEAREAIGQAGVIMGYKTYCDQIRMLTPGKRVETTPMRSEIQRCDRAIDEALAGETVAMVCSGDAGIYGMAGLLMERIAARNLNDMTVAVVPGITAATLAAAAVGAPLMNDFAVISLSDLLTERETILKRLRHVAGSGMACVLYNPRSKKRRDLLPEAIRLFREHGSADTTAAIVTHAGRDNERQWVGRLADLPVDEVDMSSVVIIGSEKTICLNGKMVTLRGYEKKAAAGAA